MNRHKNFFPIVTLVISCAQHNQSSQPQSGGIRGGGDTNKIQLYTSSVEQDFDPIEYVGSGDIRDDLTHVLTRMKNAPSFFGLLTARNVALNLEKYGLTEELIYSTSIEIKNDCRDFQGFSQSATTTIRSVTNKDTHPEVCFNLDKITFDVPNRAQMIGLFAHELTRSQGYQDEDHLLAATVANFAAKTLQPAAAF